VKLFTAKSLLYSVPDFGSAVKFYYTCWARFHAGGFLSCPLPPLKA